MTNKFPILLQQIEKDKSIKLLFACETGSRAWGFPSPDSDYDIRLIYMHHRDWYLSLHEQKDSIEIMDGDLDITGWDLRKSLLLLKKSNAPLIERFLSPIIYHEETEFADNFRTLINQYYSPTAVFYHHYSLASKFWADIKDAETFKLKGFFYLVRSLLSCNWIIQNSQVVPMQIDKLMLYTDSDVAQRLRELIALKATVDEKHFHKKDQFLHEWIIDTFKKLDIAKEALGVNSSSIDVLNNYFLQMLNRQ